MNLSVLQTEDLHRTVAALLSWLTARLSGFAAAVNPSGAQQPAADYLEGVFGELASERLLPDSRLSAGQHDARDDHAGPFPDRPGGVEPRK